MELKEYITKLKEIEKNHPDAELVYVEDESRNSFKTLFHIPVAGYLEGNKFARLKRNSGPDFIPNVVSINSLQKKRQPNVTKQELLDHFMMRVDKTPTCWNWTGTRNSKGYGSFSTLTRLIKAHWFLLDRYPDVSKGEMACHKCDNPSCVNPNHIFIGTNLDNVRDKMKKGRHRPNSKLKEHEVIEIKNTPKTYRSSIKLAKKFNVKPKTIYAIRGGETWKNIK